MLAAYKRVARELYPLRSCLHFSSRYKHLINVRCPPCYAHARPTQLRSALLLEVALGSVPILNTLLLHLATFDTREPSQHPAAAGSPIRTAQLSAAKATRGRRCCALTTAGCDVGITRSMPGHRLRPFTVFSRHAVAGVPGTYFAFWSSG